MTDTTVLPLTQLHTSAHSSFQLNLRYRNSFQSFIYRINDRKGLGPRFRLTINWWGERLNRKSRVTRSVANGY